MTQADQATLDEEAWQRLHDLVMAAHAMDLAEFRTAYLALDELKDFEKATTYLYYLLWRRIGNLVRRQPTLDDFAQLADLTYPKWGELIIADKVALEHTLRTVFGKSDFGSQIGGTTFAAYGSAALGLLLDDADAELEEARPYVASWYQRKIADG